MRAIGGYPEVASTNHLDSFTLCRASGAGLRQIVLLRPCMMMHMKHPAVDPDGVVVSEACPDEGIDSEGQPCRRRFMLKDWIPSQESCERTADHVASSLRAQGWFDSPPNASASYLPNWGYPDEHFPEQTLGRMQCQVPNPGVALNQPSL
mmetsp:Transcript_38643/g.93126  ORF Transcript_38643/g.93126 Transcript_38643/m.93126 type:complete len:150 (+) Transcript_38643:333-782(+)